MQTLILDTSWRPVLVKPWQEVITDLFNGRVKILASYEGDKIGTVRVEMGMERPAVAIYTDGKFSNHKKVRFSRDNIWLRDKKMCQYCGISLSRREGTMDHVIPKCHGGKTNWENIVLACVNCNSKKANKTLRESGMTLRSPPKRPNYLPNGFTIVNDSTVPKEWRQFIRDFEYWNAELDQD